MKKIVIAKIVKNTEIAADIFDMTVAAPEIAKNAGAGQFVEIYLDNGENLLPRPISICETDGDTIRLVYRIAGKGTRLLSERPVGSDLRILGLLGNGFSIDRGLNNHVLVGGGIGIPPLLELAKALKGEGEVKVFLGFRDNLFLVDDFLRTGASVQLATDDGSAGFKGNVVEMIKKTNPDIDCIYSCGPKVMLKGLSELARLKNIPCQVSMEERMACGVGACVGCAVKIRDGEGWNYKKVCKDGPVFNSDEVVWDE